jgi:hypothetical protein
MSFSAQIPQIPQIPRGCESINASIRLKGGGGFFGFFLFLVRYSTQRHLPPLTFHWDRTQDCCDFGIDNQTLSPLTNLRTQKQKIFADLRFADYSLLIFGFEICGLAHLRNCGLGNEPKRTKKFACPPLLPVQFLLTISTHLLSISLSSSSSTSHLIPPVIKFQPSLCP